MPENNPETQSIDAAFKKIQTPKVLNQKAIGKNLNQKKNVLGGFIKIFFFIILISIIILFPFFGVKSIASYGLDQIGQTNTAFALEFLTKKGFSGNVLKSIKEDKKCVVAAASAGLGEKKISQAAFSGKSEIKFYETGKNSGNNDLSGNIYLDGGANLKNGVSSLKSDVLIKYSNNSIIAKTDIYASILDGFFVNPKQYKFDKSGQASTELKLDKWYHAKNNLAESSDKKGAFSNSFEILNSIATSPIGDYLSPETIDKLVKKSCESVESVTVQKSADINFGPNNEKYFLRPVSVKYKEASITDNFEIAKIIFNDGRLKNGLVGKYEDFKKLTKNLGIISGQETSVPQKEDFEKDFNKSYKEFTDSLNKTQNYSENNQDAKTLNAKTLENIIYFDQKNLEPVAFYASSVIPAKLLLIPGFEKDIILESTTFDFKTDQNAIISAKPEKFEPIENIEKEPVFKDLLGGNNLEVLGVIPFIVSNILGGAALNNAAMGPGMGLPPTQLIDDANFNTNLPEIQNAS